MSPEQFGTELSLWINDAVRWLVETGLVAAGYRVRQRQHATRTAEHHRGIHAD